MIKLLFFFSVLWGTDNLPLHYPANAGRSHPVSPLIFVKI
jgi:hypothetical protein